MSQIPLEKRIQEAELKVKIYKELRDNKTKIDDEITNLNNKKSELEKKLTGVNGFENLLKNIEKETKKFESISKDPQYSAKVKHIKQSRFQKIFHFLSNIHKIAANSFRKKIIPQARKHIEGLQIIVYIIFQLILTVFTYLYTENILIIYVGFLFFFINLVLFLTSNFLPKSIASTSFVFSSASKNKAVSFEEIQSQTRSQNEDAYFVNVAWYNALLKEKERIQNTITSHLGGLSASKIYTDISVMNSKVTELQKSLKLVEERLMPPADYLKLRRELDIMKIEKDSMLKTKTPKL